VAIIINEITVFIQAYRGEWLI